MSVNGEHRDAVQGILSAIEILQQFALLNPSAWFFNSELVTFDALAGSINRLGEELNDSRFEVVHRACNLYGTGGFEIP